MDSDKTTVHHGQSHVPQNLGNTHPQQDAEHKTLCEIWLHPVLCKEEPTLSLYEKEIVGITLPSFPALISSNGEPNPRSHLLFLEQCARVKELEQRGEIKEAQAATSRLLGEVPKSRPQLRQILGSRINDSNRRTGSSLDPTPEEHTPAA